RTVDVHIRRVRSKVGPQVASHIVTIRGVGYLFRAETRIHRFRI
ncbi:MAG: response regulator transcription factor, partial [Atopobiaceae bacterium]|nr:response regulator transcription factor [Atopobiaceae bacterium]